MRGYGEVEFFLSMIKVTACIGFIIFGIIVDCGGVPTDHRGYIGARYWHDPEQAFRNGFKGFCSVFVTASFAFGGTELTGLAAAEAADPKKEIPRASKQVFWRITFFYVVQLFILGLIVPSSSDVLLGSSGANTKASPFVLAIQLAGVKGLPSVFNAVITLSVISVANSATYGSTRTMQALAANGMAPKILAYVDSKGRPIPTIILQLIFGLLAFINEATDTGATVFNWLLALSGIANFFVFGSICVAHIRFRKAWALAGHSVDELGYKSQFGVIGSYICVFMNFLCLAAQFYVALWVSRSISQNMTANSPHSWHERFPNQVVAHRWFSRRRSFLLRLYRCSAHHRTLRRVEGLLLEQIPGASSTLGSDQEHRYLRGHARGTTGHLGPQRQPRGAPEQHCESGAGKEEDPHGIRQECCHGIVLGLGLGGAYSARVACSRLACRRSLYSQRWKAVCTANYVGSEAVGVIQPSHFCPAHSSHIDSIRIALGKQDLRPSHNFSCLTSDVVRSAFSSLRVHIDPSRRASDSEKSDCLRW